MRSAHPLGWGSSLAALLWAHTALGFGPDPTSDAARFRFVVLSDAHLSVGDLGVSRARLHAAVDEINTFAANIDFVLVAGDLGDSPDATNLQTELQAARDELARLTVPYHVAIGEHDITTEGDDSAYRSRFGATNYRFAHGGVQFIGLRTAVTRTSTAMPQAALDSLNLLLAPLAPTDPLVVFGHQPLGMVTPNAVTNPSEFYTRVDAYALKGVFSGHWHGVYEEQRNGVWYCTAGALGVHVANDDGTPDKGYRLVSVLPDYSLASRFYALGHPPTFAPAPPTFWRTGNRYAVPGRALRLRLAATDPDGDALTYAARNLPTGASFDAAQRLFTWTPAAGQVGLYRNIRFLASDAATTDTLALAVRVLGDGCLQDDFEPQRNTWFPVGGAWNVVNGEMLQTNTTLGSFYSTTANVFSDAYIEADMQHDDGIGYAGLVFRYQDANNNYYLWNNGADIQVRRRVAGNATKVGNSVSVGSIAGWHHVRVETVGPNLKVYWDGTLQLDVADSTFTNGRVGFVCSKAAARFDNLVVTGCSGLPGHAPVLQPIGDRTLTVGTPVTIVLSAIDLDGAPAPLAYSARNLPPGSSYSASLHRFTWTPQPQDAGVWSGLRFAVTDGEFEDAETIRFAVLDKTGACIDQPFATLPPGWTNSGGTWKAQGGEYLGIATSAATSTYGSARLENFDLQARLRVEATGSGSGSLLFRIADATHYYALDLSATANTVELRKAAGATSYILASGAEPSGGVQNLWHLYRVEALATHLRVWVDGVLEYDVQDANPATGGGYVTGFVGLRAQNATLHTDDLLATHCAQSAVDVAEQLPRPPLTNVSVIPNPFNPATSVRFELGEPGAVRILIYDVAGRAVRHLLDAQLPAGPQAIVWNGTDDTGHGVASGVYYLRVSARNQTESRNLVLLK